MSESKDLSGNPENEMDHELVRAIGAGDAIAFEALLKRYQKAVLNFIYRYLGDRFGAEDIAQEVFLRVYRSAPDFEPRGKVSGWIFKIAYNLCVNELARRRRMCLAADPGEGTKPAIPAENYNEGRENMEVLLDLVSRLPEKQKAALLLRVNEELSYLEISNVLSVSVSSVESLIYRARENLRKMLAGRLEDDFGSRQI